MSTTLYEPRFQVREIEGYLSFRISGGPMGISVSVVDLAYNCRPLNTWRTEDIGGSLSGEKRRARIRGLAENRAAELNAAWQASREATREDAQATRGSVT